VAGAANGQLYFIFACEVHGSDDIGNSGATRDEGRLAVNSPIPRFPHGIIVIVAGPQEFAP
jgi:hypothetical protein